ncbi:MAG TPA: ATP-binding protein [Croceibacterium sp.]|nr:ATP-binding protein [Croceibacterium sp.]
MLSNHIMPSHEHQAGDPLRARVHDLRNLFTVVASARWLLERPLDESKKRMVVEGLARVAAEGKVLADNLLGGELPDRTCGCDATAELLGLAAMLRTLERPGLAIDLSVGGEPAWILMPPADCHAVVLELVTNAIAAGASRIRIEAARRGCRLWLTVADDGSGFALSDHWPPPDQPWSVHGTGLRRLASAVGLARGKVRIRSRIGSGSTFAILLPIIRVLRGNDRASPAPIDLTPTEPAHGQRSA